MTKQQEEELVDELVSDLLAQEKSIVLYNDPVNTFEHVIKSLISYCNHSPQQAEQCTIIVHYNGKCSVKNGSEKKLKPICTALLEAGLTAEIN